MIIRYHDSVRYPEKRATRFTGRWALILVVCSLLVACGGPRTTAGPSSGPSVEQPRRVGFLSQSVQSRAQDLATFRQGLTEVGLAEGQDLVIEARYAEGDLSRLAGLAQELVNWPADVIVTTSSPAIRAAMDATTVIPIVMGISVDPVQQGFVASLARPGGNVTGLSSISLPLSSKRLEILTQLVPNMSRVAVL